ncbi:MAG: hypothetical protein V1856_03275 [Candidatus Liptonbacteria bacterium]
MDADLNHLSELLTQGRRAEAKAELEAALNTELTDKERGEFLLKFATSYMEIDTMLNKDYAESIEAGIRAVRELEIAGNEEEKKQKLDELRRDILGK